MTLSEVVEDAYSYSKMKRKVTLRRRLVREDSMQGWRNTARLLNCLDSLSTLAWKLNDPRLLLSCGFGEIRLQAPPCLPMFSLQSPGTGSAQGGDARGHPSSRPSSAALWKGGEQGLLSVCHRLLVFCSLPQLICCGVEHLKLNPVAPLSTKAVAHNPIRGHIWESQAVRGILSCSHVQLCPVWI